MKQFIMLTSPDGNHKYLLRLDSISAFELETETSHAIVRYNNQATVINSESAARLADLIEGLDEIAHSWSMP